VHYREGEGGVQVCFLFGLVDSMELVEVLVLVLLCKRRMIGQSLLHGTEKLIDEIIGSCFL
jgi:hypothetical protein